MIYSLEDLKQFEQAIDFAAREIKKECRTDKPLFFHSLRVGFRLMEAGKSRGVVLAGFLHDLVEDTDCKIGQIEKRFGKKVARLVLVNTFPASVKGGNYQKRWSKAIKQVQQAGREAMIIRVADAWDNLVYLSLVTRETKRKELAWKHQFIAQTFYARLKGENLFQEYLALVKNKTAPRRG